MNVTDFLETPNDGGGDGTDNRPMNGEPELACIVQDQEMEEGMMIFSQIMFLFKFLILRKINSTCSLCCAIYTDKFTFLSSR